MAKEKNLTLPKPRTDVPKGPPRLAMKRSEFAIPKAQELGANRELYWIGILPEFPFQWLAVGGITFIKDTNPPIGTDRDTGISQRRYVKGDVLSLTDKEVALILKKMAKRVLRWIRKVDAKQEDDAGAKRPSGRVLRTDIKGYVPSNRDEPIAKYLWMMRKRDIADATWVSDPAARPPTVWDLAEED